MRLIFAGTPAFAASALEALLGAGHDIALVLTQPDRPAGRGMKLVASPVKQLAIAHGLPVYQPEKLRTAEQQAPLAALEVDVMVVAAYGIILPQVVLDMPRLGCLNIHASLLPRWRGAAPIQRAIAAGDAETGITIMQMNAGLDTGDMLSMHRLPIAADDTSHTLHDKLAAEGAAAIVAALADLDALRAHATPQPDAGVTYAEKIRKEEALVDWTLSADTLARRLRAFDPFPGLQSSLHGTVVKFWKASAVAGSGVPGQILSADSQGVVVACAEGALCISELQRPGGKRLAVRDFLAGGKLDAGSLFDTAATS